MAGAQQIRGSGSPTSMSTIRLPPKAVSSRTRPSGSARTSPTSAASRAERVRAQPLERVAGRLRRDDRDELALVRDVERVDAEDLAGADDLRPERQRGLLERDGERRSRGELVQRRRQAAARRVAQPAQRLAELEQRRGELVHRRRVALELDLERELAAGDHHRHAVVAERARDEHPVAGRARGRRRAARPSRPSPMPAVLM